MKVKQLLKLVLPMFFLLSSATSIQAQDLAGRYFGKVKYEGQSREVALLLNSIESEPGNYYGVVYEYLNAYNLGFILKFVKPGQKNGYLQELLQWVQIYKFVVDGNSNGQVFKMHRLSVVNGEIKTNPKAEASKLTLSESVDEDESRLEGAKLSMKIKGKDVVVNFKSRNILGFTVDDITKRFPLESTWENKYTPGPYNPGYKQAETRVLELVADYNRTTKTATANFNVEKLNSRSLEVKGAFIVKQAEKGMFTYTAKNPAQTKGAALVQDKIGVFVDVFDFKPRMATVELILIDPANDTNSQMYFEEFGNADVEQIIKK